jgi:hypothetical protein
MNGSVIAIVGSAAIVASAHAGWVGFVAYSRNVGTNTVIDVFAAVTNASDKFLNVYDLTSNGTFGQKAGLATKTWKPDVSGFTSTRNTADDSFMTAGTFSGGAYGGEYYASTNTVGDPNFTGNSWNATPASAAATAIPSRAGWYTGDPTSVDNNAELMSAWAGGFTRTNSVRVGFPFPSPETASAMYGIWITHLVIAGNNRQIGIDFTYGASASIKDGATGTTSDAYYYFAPAPGALALLGLAGLARSRRR